MKQYIPAFIPDQESEQCQRVQPVLGALCGCRSVSNPCTLCPDGAAPLHPGYALPEDFSELFAGINDPTCAFTDSLLAITDHEDPFCLHVQLGNAEFCGCSAESLAALEGEDSNEGYVPGSVGGLPIDLDHAGISIYGMNSPEENDIQDNIYRSAAILSIIGAVCVVLDNIRKFQKHLYNKLILLMAVFDILYSVAACFMSLPAPVDENVDYGLFAGNEATCKAQGFFLQWGGLTSLFFNGALSTYYVFVIVFRARASRLQELQKYLIGIPLTLGLIFGCASIPFIQFAMRTCHVETPFDVNNPLEPENWGPFLGLVLVPAYCVLLYCTVALAFIYYKVRRVEIKSEKWRFPSKNVETNAMATSRFSLRNSATASGALAAATSSRRRKQTKLRTRVIRQSAMYLFALYLSWMLYLTLASVPEFIHEGSFEAWSTALFFLPLQGFLNALVYFFHRILKWIRKLIGCLCCRSVLCCRKSQSHTEQDHPTSSTFSNISSTDLVPETSVSTRRSSMDASSMDEPTLGLIALNGIIMDECEECEDFAQPAEKPRQGFSELPEEPHHTLVSKAHPLAMERQELHYSQRIVENQMRRESGLSGSREVTMDPLFNDESNTMRAGGCASTSGRTAGPFSDDEEDYPMFG